MSVITIDQVIMEAVRFSETSAHACHTTLHSILENVVAALRTSEDCICTDIDSRQRDVMTRITSLVWAENTVTS
jgi:hypothetical protein